MGCCCWDPWELNLLQKTLGNPREASKNHRFFVVTCFVRLMKNDKTYRFSHGSVDN